MRVREAQEMSTCPYAGINRIRFKGFIQSDVSGRMRPPPGFQTQNAVSEGADSNEGRRPDTSAAHPSVR